MRRQIILLVVAVAACAVVAVDPLSPLGWPMVGVMAACTVLSTLPTRAGRP